MKSFTAIMKALRDIKAGIAEGLRQVKLRRKQEKVELARVKLLNTAVYQAAKANLYRNRESKEL